MEKTDMSKPTAPIKSRMIRRSDVFFAGLMFFLIMMLPLVFSACQTTAPAKKNPESDPAVTKRNIGEANMMQGNYTVALRELLAAEKLDPDDPVTQNYLGITYKNKNMPEKAIEHFNKALSLKPDYSNARNNLGTVYLDKGEWDIAIGYFKSVLDDILYMTPHFPLSNIGWAYYNKGEFTQAKSYYLKALEIQPDFIVAMNGLGQTYMSLKEYEQAAFTFQRLVKQAPKVPDFQLKLARALEMNGDAQQAAHHYSRYLQLAPNSPRRLEIRDRIDALNRQ